jgi:hypothetical protein
MRYLIFAVCILMIPACSQNLYYYTKAIHNDGRWSEAELKKIQFYVSNDIILWKQAQKGSSQVVDGKIKILKGKEVEEVVIKKGTPGVYVFSPQKNHYAISFDPKNDQKFLVFGPSEKTNGRYVLLAKEWDRDLGKVSYGNETYQTSAESAFVNLMVDMSKTKNTKIKSSNPSGRKVKN